MSNPESKTSARPCPLLRMTGIGKKFDGVQVLENVQLEVHAGEVHVLAGENGAGKSTLIKILAGVHTEFEGRVELLGREIRPPTPLAASQIGIAVIHQELSLIKSMTVADNIFLGRMPSRLGWLRQADLQSQAAEWVAKMGLDLDVSQPVEAYSLAIQQLIEIAKALSQQARIIVMDEPTSALNAVEAGRLFSQIQSLKQQGCGIIYITHKMEEIETLADRITVLRDGKWIGTAPANELPISELMRWMVGRELGEQFPRHPPSQGAERLRLDSVGVFPNGFSRRPAVQGVSLTVHAGEIVGLGGLQGSGVSELFLGLFGAYGNAVRGGVYWDGQKTRFESPRHAITAGLALLTDDRKATGLVLSLSVAANATLAGLRELSAWGWRQPKREVQAAEQAARSMRLRAASLNSEVRTLSGGSQQKVAIAKWIQVHPKLMLLNEPTRGIDIGAKREIYQLINEWTAQGIAILLITSELPELLTLSDRIIVFHRGACSGEFTREQATPEAILAAAMGSGQSADKARNRN